VDSDPDVSIVVKDTGHSFNRVAAVPNPDGVTMSLPHAVLANAPV
jgi:hypothetical protein